ncbi:hypothetical protein Cgig2_027236 [Carnegiea gigantea]|uniref:Uncharacterized protein n=1 Tax=Carnegiea gigantea TaxID=171969 RepID=A0A9Q1JJI7_9CARY|nr:hypothetical protein Cgig2_012089 [Carnegiea gigantea]KAJ8435027.1 hypothetical protein Cgig2_027236 [Carnegiea gigantea]
MDGDFGIPPEKSAAVVAGIHGGSIIGIGGRGEATRGIGRHRKMALVVGGSYIKAGWREWCRNAREERSPEIGHDCNGLKNDDKSPHDPIYRRSSSLNTLAVSPPPDSRITWTRKEMVRKGTLSYSYNDEKSCIDLCRGYANFFNAMVREKINTESNGDEKFVVTPSFYPVLHTLLTFRRNWGSKF